MAASGLNGQNFAFIGYLPQDASARTTQIQQISRAVQQSGQTRIVIETPYRNRQMMQTLVDTCAAQTRIGIATDLTLDSEQIMTLPSGDWKRGGLPDIDRRPTVFLLQA